MAIHYVSGDALKFVGFDVLIHQANCINVMGSGIAKQIREQYPEAWAADCHASEDLQPKDKLGWFSYANLISNSSRFIVNMYSQLTTGGRFKEVKERDTDYEAMDHALGEILSHRKLGQRTYGIPYLMGCDLGGGDWNEVEKILEKHFVGEGKPDLVIVKWDKMFL